MKRILAIGFILTSAAIAANAGVFSIAKGVVKHAAADIYHVAKHVGHDVFSVAK